MGSSRWAVPCTRCRCQRARRKAASPITSRWRACPSKRRSGQRLAHAERRRWCPRPSARRRPGDSARAGSRVAGAAHPQ
eukprot:9474896-Pyramimonas_sp.AAC.1